MKRLKNKSWIWLKTKMLPNQKSEKYICQTCLCEKENHTCERYVCLTCFYVTKTPRELTKHKQTPCALARNQDHPQQPAWSIFEWRKKILSKYNVVHMSILSRQLWRKNRHAPSPLSLHWWALPFVVWSLFFKNVCSAEERARGEKSTFVKMREHIVSQRSVWELQILFGVLYWHLSCHQKSERIGKQTETNFLGLQQDVQHKLVRHFAPLVPLHLDQIKRMF